VPLQTEYATRPDAYVARVLTEFQVPGLSVAIVKDSKITLTKGYGVRKLNEPTPVDEHTLFGIGSNTKAFTTAALATLLDEGKRQISYTVSLESWRRKDWNRGRRRFHQKPGPSKRPELDQANRSARLALGRGRAFSRKGRQNGQTEPISCVESMA